MISKRIKGRRDGMSSVADALHYGEGLKVDRETGELLDKSHRTRLGNFGLVDDGVYAGRGVTEMEKIISRAAFEMQANCDQNGRVGVDKKLAHFVVSFNQDRPNEAVLLDTEDSMLAAMDLQGNHFATFLHNDNGYWHLHIFASRIEKDEPHNGNSLWNDQTKRDKVCRQIEARHGLQPDNGMHVINEAGKLVEVPRAERRGRQEAKRAEISDRARTTEIHRGEKSFQSWATEIRLGDRLKHARSWSELHHAAAAYDCEIRQKGAGFIVCQAGQTVGIQLSRLGLKNLPHRLGEFQKASLAGQEAQEPSDRTAPAPALGEGKAHYRGEQPFLSWATEIRLGDRLKHARSWSELHHAAAAYDCEIRQKGAGFIVSKAGQADGIQLSRLGLKNLPQRLGAFQKASRAGQEAQEASHRPAPVLSEGKEHFEAYSVSKGAFKSTKTERMNAQRGEHAAVRLRTRAAHKAELTQIRRQTAGPETVAAISLAKMQHAVDLANLTKEFAEQRQALRTELASTSPGNTFRDYLILEAAKGDNVALGLARRYGVRETTDVLALREAEKLQIVAAVRGNAYRPAPRLNFTHQVDRYGTVVYDFGAGRKVTDSAIARQVQLNHAAATSPEAIATALTFAANKFGNTLTLTGSAEFQRLAVETAVTNRLGVKFADPGLDAYRAKLDAQRTTTRTGRVPDLSHLTPQQIAKGVNDVLTRSLDRGRPPEHVIRAEQSRRQILAAQAGRSVHELPAGSLDGAGQEPGVLLPNTLPGRVGDDKAGQDQDVRRTGTGAPGSGKDDEHGLAESKRFSVIDEARAALVAELRRQGVEVREIIDEKKFVGKVRLITDQLVVQGVAPNSVVVHDLRYLTGTFSKGQEAAIEYHNGRGTDKLQQVGQSKKPGQER